MSKKVKSEFAKFKSYESTNKSGVESKYARLTRSLMDSPAVQTLSHPAYRAYIEMRMVALWERDFELPRHVYGKYMAPATFVKAVKELEAHGLIECTEHNQNRRENNRYRFIDGWQAWKPK